MLVLIGTVSRVTEMKSKLDEAGKPLPPKATLTITHLTQDDPDSSMELISVGIKDAKQLEAFKAVLGKNIRVPLRTWKTDTGSGFWIEKGVLPTVVQTAAPQAKAA